MTATDIAQIAQIEQIAAELYEANRDNFIADIASVVSARFESGLTQLNKGETIGFNTFKSKVNDIDF